MSTEVTPESLRTHATWLDAHCMPVEAAALRCEADHLERQQLPTVPGWYPGIVVERGGESCTGALLADDESWQTALCVGDHHTHYPHSGGVTIRWAEQDGTTPGQTLWEADSSNGGPETWPWLSLEAKDYWERVAAAVLAAHGTPTLTPVGEHPEPGTRGLLPVVQESGEWCSRELGMFLCLAGSTASRAILVDPRPDGAHE